MVRSQNTVLKVESIWINFISDYAMNRTIKFLILSDIFILTGFGLTSPIFAIFIKEGIIGGTIFAAGLSSTLFLITKSLVQLPFSRYVDKEKDKKRLLIIGTSLIVIVPFLYLLVSNVRHIYIVQIIYGIGSGIAYPTRLGIWTLALDKKHESFERSLYSTATGVGTAIAAAVGGALAQYAGFDILFITVGIFSIIGGVILIKLKNKFS
ncbi:MAG: MFS transporter [Candidatus Absconditicoccaceae bacterium]